MDKITKSIMDQDIKQSFLLIWFINWIKPISKGGEKNLVSNSQIITWLATLWPMG